MSEEYGVYYRPDVATGRLRRARNALLWRLGSTLVSVGFAAAAWYFWPQQIGPWAPWYIGATVAVGVAYAVVNVIQLVRTGVDARVARYGLAIGLNRDGMLVGQRWFPWPEVGSVVIRPGGLGASAALVATGRDRSASRVPIDYTDTMPASLDTAVRVLSAGRAWVDLSRLD